MKKKMNLAHFKVTSFVTNLDRESVLTVKGGDKEPLPQWSNPYADCHISRDPKKCFGHSEYATACQSGKITCIPPLDEKPVDFTG